MTKLLVACMAVAAFCGAPALAADLPAQPQVYTKAPVPAPVPAPVYSWTGFYVGANAGAAWGNFAPLTSTPSVGLLIAPDVALFNAAGASQSIKPSGLTGGFEAGYNWQANNLVFGLEGDIEAFSLKGSVTTAGTFPGPVPFTLASSASTNWLATTRARVGVAANNWLFYGTGGAAFTTLKGNFAFSDAVGDAAAASLSNTKAGYALGGGVEVGLWDRWTVKAEYLYVDFGTVSATGGFSTAPAQVVSHSMDLKANIARLGLNYKFN